MGRNRPGLLAISKDMEARPDPGQHSQPLQQQLCNQ